ncbi:hypothetical protein LCGC14_2867060 [marine sediment metagenome]|uniref:Uncharacterized protein n=1 Tax=marine sediment metagenome TaxID=412755 RepID=A0A0F8Y487_9ZZZZ
MDWLITLYVLLGSILIATYMALVLKLINYVDDNINGYAAVLIFMIGYVGLPLAILAGFFF